MIGIEEFRKKVTELIAFFDNDYDYPETINESDYTHITDPRKYVDSHIETIKAHSENKTYKPYLDRLLWMRKYVLDNNLKVIGSRKEVKEKLMTEKTKVIYKEQKIKPKTKRR